MNINPQSFLFTTKCSLMSKAYRTVTITVFATKLLISGLKKQVNKQQVQKEIYFQTTQYVVDWEYNHSKALEGFSLCKQGNKKYEFGGNHDQLCQLKDTLNGLMPYCNWEKDYQFKKFIRKTTKCQIFLAQSWNNMKVIKLIEDFQTSQELAILRILKLNPHPNILGLDQFYIDQQNCFVAMEYCPYGTLYELQKSYNSHVPLSVIRDVMQQILEGLNHLHQLNIIHRDLKYDNLMVQNMGKVEVKIIDFGLSVNAISTDSRAGTGGYIAPEIFSQKKSTEKSDIFSAGVILHKLLTSKGVYDSLQQNQAGELHISSHIRDEDARDLVHQMLQKDPDLRYSSSDCLAHPFFTDECDHLSSKTSLIDYLSPKQVKLQVHTPSTDCVSGKNINAFKLC